MSNGNVYFQLAHEVEETLTVAGIGTINAQANLLNDWTTATQILTEDWLQNPANPSPEQQDLINAIASIGTKGGSTVADIIAQYMNASTDLPLWNSSLAVALLAKLSQNWNTTTGPSQLNFVNNWTSIITSTAGETTGIGDTMTKEVQSMVQQSVSGTQVVANIGTLMVGLLTAFASATGLSA